MSRVTRNRDQCQSRFVRPASHSENSFLSRVLTPSLSSKFMKFIPLGSIWDLANSSNRQLFCEDAQLARHRSQYIHILSEENRRSRRGTAFRSRFLTSPGRGDQTAEFRTDKQMEEVTRKGIGTLRASGLIRFASDSKREIRESKPRAILARVLNLKSRDRLAGVRACSCSTADVHGFRVLFLSGIMREIPPPLSLLEKVSPRK